MTSVVGLLLFISSVTSLPVCSDKSCILEAGDRLLQEERQLAMGANVALNEKERIVDAEVLRPMKSKEIQSREIRSYTNLLDGELLTFLKRMPKGGNLHLHDMAMVDVRWVIDNLTYLPDLYYCRYTTEIDEFIRFRFSNGPPEKADFCDTEWFSVEEKRKKVGPKKFDEMLMIKLTMVHIPLRHEGDTWNEFINSLIPIGDLAYSEEGFRLYFKQALVELYEDNVLYVEVRTLLYPLSRPDGTSCDREHTLRQYISVAEEFKREHPDFIGVKFISISVRSLPKASIEEDIRFTMDLYQRYPRDVAGYDLVGFENDGPPLRDLLDLLLIPSKEGVNLPYFFHAGETNRFGEAVDEDIVFAILLNASRIAHAYSLAKHPKIMDLVYERQIPLEVCPLSNHVLSLVDDLRNHPATILISNGLPVIINSDDPAAWHLSGLSHDYFATFMGFTRADDGLAFLKELSRQGIKYIGKLPLEIAFHDGAVAGQTASKIGRALLTKATDRPAGRKMSASKLMSLDNFHSHGTVAYCVYSAMSDDEKSAAFAIWQRRWDDFINFYYDRWQKDNAGVHSEL